MEVIRQPVSRSEIESLWDSVRAQTSNPQAGIFGPSSVSWKVNRESALFLGAGRAALLQLAHPWVATALDHHSNLRNDPLARFHNTFRVVFTMIFGTLSQALAASRQLYNLHTKIKGELPEQVGGHPKGSPYQANEVNALLWVYATLLESALLAYETVLPPLSNTEREAYYSESKTLAGLFGIPATALPANWSAFEAYNRAMLTSNMLGVNTLSREMAHRVLHGRGSWVPVPDWYRALTASSLPERLRSEFALTYGKREEDAATTASKRLAKIYHRAPAALRFVGPYQEANARLQKSHVNALTRASNRFWMGQPRMIYAELASDTEPRKSG
ncbi:MAG: oxygenase MpaB family protein [Edaphobacter sp.]